MVKNSLSPLIMLFCYIHSVSVAEYYQPCSAYVRCVFSHLSSGGVLMSEQTKEHRNTTQCSPTINQILPFANFLRGNFSYKLLSPLSLIASLLSSFLVSADSKPTAADQKHRLTPTPFSFPSRLQQYPKCRWDLAFKLHKESNGEMITAETEQSKVEEAGGGDGGYLMDLATCSLIVSYD